MSRRIWMSILTLLLAFCIGLSLIAAGVMVITRQNNTAPAQLIPVP